ncbi:MAG TPA: BadF/BadG/BcrA/BcrD ATPase family protein [Kribbella sp.]|uniref:N-acetylglucosamine kinase n=1 Tax=Kribbella sp. TaxID=1871183 RepID=UPI002D77A16D|nr:BadF/BadG/BcrA/BcrD ATPase family protein [Kribbella sp.]HET6297350.1 BadF/BadG/BcrA/BcrD ATPase family protein [Kribbella sp.]
MADEVGLVRPLVPGGVLAFDAGNSKTDVALVAADGTVLGTARGGGFEPHLVGALAAVTALEPLVLAACADAGLVVGDGGRAPGRGPLVQQVSACLANADLPIEEEQLAESFRSFGWGTSVYVANDTFALLRAGVDEPRGVAVVCGAGINCAGLLPDGRTARFAAIGKISGDWGGGQQLADEAFWAAARSADGRGPTTALETALPAHYGVESMAALIEAFHLGDLPVNRRLEASPLLFQVAAAGDAIAKAVVQHQAEEVVAMAVVAMRRLDLLDEPTDVVLGGGVLTAGHPLLTETVVRLLATAAPKAVARVVDVPPVVGAALLGLDHTNAAPSAHLTLRSSYAASPAA